MDVEYTYLRSGGGHYRHIQRAMVTDIQGQSQLAKKIYIYIYAHGPALFEMHLKVQLTTYILST